MVGLEVEVDGTPRPAANSGRWQKTRCFPMGRRRDFMTGVEEKLPRHSREQGSHQLNRLCLELPGSADDV